MRTFSTANVLASGIGLLFLAAIMGLAAALFLPHDEHLWPLTIAAYAGLAPIALWSWSGAMFRNKGSKVNLPLSAREWVGMFFLNLLISVAFVAFDMAVGHPGLSVVFTIGAVSMTLVALPGAVRAWLLQALIQDNV